MKVVYDYTPQKSRTSAVIHSLYADKWRYKILWELRSLENDIEADQEDGIIVVPAIGEKSEIQIIGFSEELAGQIYTKLQCLVKGKAIL